MKISKKMTNNEIAELLRAVAAAYQIKDKDKNKFRIVAYQRAADAVEHLSSEAKDIWDDGKLMEISGVGPSIANHLDEIFKTGKSIHFSSVMRGLPMGMFELMKVSGIGPKTAYKLSKKLNIEDGKTAIKKLEEAVKKGEVSDIEGFGEQSEDAMEKSIKEVKDRKVRILLSYAESLAEPILEWLMEDTNVKDVNVLGSLRRKASTIGDIDIAAATINSAYTLDHFSKYPKATRVLEKGDRTASIILPGNVQVDLMVQKPDSYGSLLQHFTGSKHHNISLREYAQKRGLSLSEYGIKKGQKRIKTKTEEDFYKKLGMNWIPPELREDMGEIEAAREGNLPKLIELSDIKADLQIHSDFDIETSHDVGDSSMEEIINEASRLGYEYIAFTEHNPSQSGHRDKEVINILKRKKEKIEKINSSLVKNKSKSVKKVFNSLEIDILPDGDLAISNAALDILDFALVSVHSSFRQSKTQMTQRILKALDHPKVKIFAHPTARKLNHREGIEIEWPKVFDFCKRNNKWIEINGDPMRLDLPDIEVKEAIKAGVKLTMGTDSHSKDHLINMQYAVSVARRGWATKKDIINTLSLTEFDRILTKGGD